MNQHVKPGDYVVWRWSNGYNHGKVIDIKNGIRADPLLTIVDHNDTRVLKRASEVEKAD